MTDCDLKSVVQPHVPSNSRRNNSWRADTWQAWATACIRLSGESTEHVSPNLLRLSDEELAI